MSSWGYPTSLLPRAGESFDTVTFVGAGHAIRRAAWDGYDEALFFCWEEFDFCLRAIERGWRIRYRGDIAVRHKVSPEQRVAWSGTRWFHFVRNRLYIERKWGAGWLSACCRASRSICSRARATACCRRPCGAWQPRCGMSAGSLGMRHSPAARDYLRLHDAAASRSMDKLFDGGMS